MVSTTWVQFIKGSLLVVFCTILVVLILNRGLEVKPISAPQVAIVVSTLQSDANLLGVARLALQ